MSALKRKANGPNPDAKKAKSDGNIMSFFGGKTAAKAPGQATKFNKAKWVSTLTGEQKELLKLEIETLHESWLGVLRDELTTKEFLDLKRFLIKEENMGKRVFPSREDIYSWFVPIPSSSSRLLPLWLACELTERPLTCKPGPDTRPSTPSKSSS